MPAKLASTKQVAAIARGLSSEYLQCRDVGHQWKLYYQSKQGVQIIRRMYCPSCKTNRTLKINRYGEVISNSYDYSDGYLISGLGRVQGRSKSLLRVEAINRQPEIDLDLAELFGEFEEPNHADLAV